MEVSAHQAPRVQTPAEHVHDPIGQQTEAIAVDVVVVDLDSASSACGDVEDALLREVRSGDARHVGSTVAGAQRGIQAAAREVTLSLQGLSPGPVG
jgi:hypothetical protein